jgi:hypothetical protein
MREAEYSAGGRTSSPRYGRNPPGKETRISLHNSIIAPEHQVGPRRCLTYFLEIDPRCDAQSLKRGQERERLSTIHIGDRTANPYREVELDHGPALLLLRIFITTSALSPVRS